MSRFNRYFINYMCGLSTAILLENKDILLHLGYQQSFVNLPEPTLQIGYHSKMTLMLLCLLVGAIPCVFSMRKVNSPKWGTREGSNPKSPSSTVRWRMNSVSRRTDPGQTEILVFADHSLNTQIMFIHPGENPRHSTAFS